MHQNNADCVNRCVAQSTCIYVIVFVPPDNATEYVAWVFLAQFYLVRYGGLLRVHNASNLARAKDYCLYNTILYHSLK